MRVILFLLEKEFKQIFRNKAMLPIIFVMPMIQLLILSFAIDYEVKNLRLYVIDNDQSKISRDLVADFTSSSYFKLVGSGHSQVEAMQMMDAWKTDLILQIPADFEKSMILQRPTEVLLKLDALDGSKAGVAAGYSQQILSNYINSYLKQQLSNSKSSKAAVINPILLFNPLKNYKKFMVPGILVVLVTMIAAFLSSMNIVREKELGNIEQINVTPIKKYQFVFSKTMPFWIIGLLELSVGLLIAYLVFDIQSVGPLWIIYSFAAIYLFLILGFGLLISTVTQTQQQAMFITWFFLVIFLLMGGLFTPIESMPQWAQYLTYLDPIRYFIELTRAVMLKGAGFEAVWDKFVVIAVFSLLMILLAIKSYRKTAA